MADNVTLPASGTGDTTPKVSTQQVSGTLEQVQDVELAEVVGGTRTRIGLAAKVGIVTETAPGTDTASSGLNGRMQRVAQRLTSLIALLPASLGQKTMANGLAVTVASDQSVIPVSDNAGSLTVDAPAGTPVAVRFSDGASLQTPVRVDNAAFTDNASNVTPVAFIFDEVAGVALTEDDAAAARIDSKRAQVYVLEDATTRGQRAAVSAANALKVDGSAVTQPTKEIRSSTGTNANVASSATSVTILASNANRLGATITNDSTAILYLKFGTTAATTDYLVQLPGTGALVSPAYYEVPYGYTGRIDGIWASANGNARVCEIT